MKTIRKKISHKKKLSRQKYNSNLKNKNTNKNKNKNTNKRKKSVLRGGANNSPSPSISPSSNNSLRPSIKYSVKKHENTGLLEYIFVRKDYIKYSGIYQQPYKETTDHKGDMLKVYNNNNEFFRKYVFINGNIYYVYPNKSNPEEPIIYCVFECTNQSITIDMDINLEHTIVITPLELSVDTMQLAINTGSLQIIESSRKEKDGRDKTDNPGKPNDTIYLGFDNFPSLVINKVSHSYKSSRKHAVWVNIYEDEDTFNHNLTQPYIYDFNIHYQDKLSKEGKYEEITFSNNADYFNEMKTKIKAKMVEMQTNSSETLKHELEDLFKRVLFGRFVKKEDNTIIQQMDGLEWLMRNTLWLEDYLALSNSFKSHTHNVNTKLNLFDTPEFKEFKDNDALYDCDFTGLDMKYIIVDEFVNMTDASGDGETYVICGYPDKSMKEIVLNFWQEKENTEENKAHNALVKALNSNHLSQQGKNIEFFLKLFEKYKPRKLENQTYNEGDLYMSLREGIFDYIEKRYAELYSSYSTDVPEYKVYKEYFTYSSNDTNQSGVIHFTYQNNGKLNKFREDAKHYFQKIGQKYLSKPLTQIKYIFLAFKQNQTTGLLEPLIFNVKELKKEHQPILKRIERLIKNDLPTKFGILLPDEKDKYPDFDDEYKLWYSRYRYGKFFHIETEYVHTMSNIADKAHNYKNTITLEELIYSCGLDYEPDYKTNNVKFKTNVDKTSFFEHLRIEYEIREYSLESTTPKMSKSRKYSKYSNKKTNTQSNCKIIENRSEKVFCLYEEDKKLKEKGKEKYKEKQNSKTKAQILSLNEKDLVSDHFGNKENIKKIQIILVFKTNRQEYIFIYYYKDEFYKIVIESNISQILYSIIIELNKNINVNVINFSETNKGLKIVSIDKLDDKYYHLIFHYNPIIMKKLYNNIKYETNNSNKMNIDKIDTSYYYDTVLLDKSLIKNNVLLVLINIYKLYNTTSKKPILVQNFLNSNSYKTRLQSYLTNKSQEICKFLSYEENIPDFWKCIIQDCPNIKINCIFYDVDGCGYDFIESIDHSANKIIVYIVPNKHPKNIKNIKNKYIGNFMDLDIDSLDMLNAFKKKYDSYNCICFLHATITTMFYCLHFHIVKKIDNIHDAHYNRIYNDGELGSFIIQDMFLYEIINNLNINNNYYKNTNFSLIKTY